MGLVTNTHRSRSFKWRALSSEDLIYPFSPPSEPESEPPGYPGSPYGDEAKCECGADKCGSPIHSS